MNGNVTAARLLLDRGADVSANKSDGMRPLHSAAGNGRAAVARLLVERGANIEQQCLAGNTALHYAVKAGSRETVEELIALGASTTARNKVNKLPRELATAKFQPQFDQAVLAGQKRASEPKPVAKPAAAAAAAAAGPRVLPSLPKQTPKAGSGGDIRPGVVGADGYRRGTNPRGFNVSCPSGHKTEHVFRSAICDGCSRPGARTEMSERSVAWSGI